MRTTIKIVKRNQINQRKKQEPETKQTAEQSTREIVMAVKKWVTELKERKAMLMY